GKALMGTQKNVKRLAIVLGIASAVLVLGLIVVVLVAWSPDRRIAMMLQKASIYRRHGQLDDERKALEEALNVKPEDAGLKAKLGRNCAARGDLERAEQLLRESVETNED